MDYNQRERLVNRIISGQIRLEFNNTTHVINNITPQIKYEASEIYYESLSRASFYEVFTEKELHFFLLKNQLWSVDKQAKLDALPKTIEDLKLEIYNAANKSNSRKQFREQLNTSLDEYGKLYNELHLFDYLSCVGFADYNKSKFILAKSLNVDLNLITDSKFDSFMHKYSSIKLGEKEYRELARTEPWRTYWVLSKHQPLFSYSVSEYSEEQKQLCFWSKMYDNIYESSACPHDSIIEDDDMLDGWLIKQRKEREQDMLKKQGDDMISNNPKLKNAGEIFVMCETMEDAEKIDSLNDAYAKMVKKQRLLSIAEKGELKECDLPDVKMELMMESNKMLSNKIRGN